MIKRLYYSLLSQWYYWLNLFFGEPLTMSAAVSKGDQFQSPKGLLYEVVKAKPQRDGSTRVRMKCINKKPLSPLPDTHILAINDGHFDFGWKESDDYNP